MSFSPFISTFHYLDTMPGTLAHKMDLSCRPRRTRSWGKEIWTPDGKFSQDSSLLCIATGNHAAGMERKLHPGKKDSSAGESPQATGAAAPAQAKGTNSRMSLRSTLTSILSFKQPAINRPDADKYRWGIETVWEPSQSTSTSASLINALVYYKDIPSPRRYDAPPLGWPSNRDIDPKKGFLRTERNYKGMLVWARYMEFLEKACSRCSTSFLAEECPTCGSKNWQTSAWWVLEVANPSLERLATLDLGYLRAAYVPVR